MQEKQCPKCKRYSVSFDFSRGVEVCRWKDCGWVNTEHLNLPVAYTTVITSHKNAIAEGTLAQGKLARGS